MGRLGREGEGKRVRGLASERPGGWATTGPVEGGFLFFFYFLFLISIPFISFSFEQIIS
jgi:hypothetical protein